MEQRSELENVKVCVVLPLFDSNRLNHSRNSTGNGSNLIIDYESTFDSTCFSKPLISFTINSFERFESYFSNSS